MSDPIRSQSVDYEHDTFSPGGVYLSEEKYGRISRKTKRFLRLIVIISGVFSILSGMLVLTGWIFDIGLLKSLNPSFISMKANTAICFILAGTALLIHELYFMKKIAVRFAVAFEIVVIAISTITIAEYLFSWNAGIDEFLFRDISVNSQTVFPGRLAINTCLAFLFLSLSLLMLSSRIKFFQFFSRVLPVIAGLLALMPIFGYLYGVKPLLALGFYTSTALQTAATLLIMTIGTICLQHSSDFMTILNINNLGGYVARRLLPVTILIPIAFLWIRLILKTHDAQSGSTDVLVVSVLYIIIIVFSVWKIATSVNIIENEREKIYNDLRQSEGRFFTAFHSSPAALLITRKSDGTILDLNDAYSRIIGIPYSELIGKSTVSLNIWVETAQRDKMLDSLNSGTHLRDFEISLRHGSGEIRTALASFENIKLHDEECIIASAIDITEWKAAQEEIKVSEMQNSLSNEILEHLNSNTDSEKMIRAVISSIKVRTGIEAVAIRIKKGDDFPYYSTSGFPDEFVEAERSLCTYDIDGNIERDSENAPLHACMCGNILHSRVDTSKSFFTYGGSFRSNNTTLLLSTTTNDDRLARTRNRCNSAGYESVALIPLRSGSEIIGLLQLNDHRKDFFDEKFIPFFERLGSSIGIAIMRNKAENELKNVNIELEKRVAERTEELLESNKELESFAYSVSHDLRAPLRHVVGFSDILEAELGENIDPEITRITGIIKSSADRMNNLIDQLLNYSRLGRTNLRKIKVELNPIINELIAEASDVTKDRKIEWRINTLPEALADPLLIRLVFQNLIHNALKFSSKKDSAVIEINCESKDGTGKTFYINDNGAGFDMKYYNKLFGVFQRLHTDDEFEGTGIGLATVKRIIKRHGGSVWAESRVDEGATFFFTLPD